MESPRALRRPVVAPVLSRALLCAVLATGAISATLLISNHPDDHFSSAQQQARDAAFQASLPLALTLVAPADLHDAIAAMHLPANSHIRLLTSASPTALLTAATPPRLAWITLWDSDVQDGDAVRIESAGYARTVSLTKLAQTFAIPVAVDGKVTLTGVRDGDGGGITVGVASGPQQVLVPIMSVGQVLPLNVRIE